MTTYRKESRIRSSEKLELIGEFTSKYRARITRGLSVYGEFNAATDGRVLAHEAIEECLDIGSYLEMCEEKWPHLTSKIQPIRAKTILLYGELKTLEELELALTRG